MSWISEVGRWAAFIAPSLILVLAIVRGILTMRQPETHRLCQSALLLFYAALLPLTVGALVLFIRHEPADTLGLFSIAASVGWISALFLMVGIVFAIVGLFSFGFSGGRYRSGHVAAILALPLQLLLLGGGFGAFLYSSVKLEDKVAETMAKVRYRLDFPEQGFKVNLQDTGWGPWEDVEEGFPEADFGAHLRDDASLGIVSFDLRGLDPSLEDLAAACVEEVWGHQYPEDIQGKAPFTQGKVTGLEISMRRDVGETYPDEDRLRVFKHAGRGWFVIVWAGGATSGALKEAVRAFEKVEVSDMPMPEKDAKLSKAQLNTRAHILNNLGLSAYHRGAYEEALKRFVLAYGLNPENSTLVTNQADALVELDRPVEAAKLLQSKLAQFGIDPDYRARLAWHWQQAGEDEKALGMFKDLFQGKYKNEEYLFEYLNLLASHDRQAEALTVLTDYTDTNGNNDNLTRWQANILNQLDRTEEAVALLENRVSTGDNKLAFLLGQYCLEVNKPERTLEICSSMEKDTGDTTWDIAWLRGEAFMVLERYHDAKIAYEKALELNSQNETVRHSLSRASALLGEGNNSIVKTEIPPVEIPAELLATWEKNAPDDLPVDDYGQHILHKVTMFHFEPGLPLRSTTYQKVKITGEQGLTRYAQLRYTFDPLSERLFVNELLVRNAKGEIVGKGDVRDYYVMDENDSQMATENKVLYLPVPGLAPGSTLEIVLTRQQGAQTLDFGFHQHAFYDTSPSVYHALGVTGAVDKVRANVQGGVQPHTGKGYLAWSFKHPPVYEYEEMQPELHRFMPSVTLGPVSGDWSQLGEAYLARMQTLLEESATEVTAAAREVVQGATTEEEKIRRLARYVQTLLSYNAIEFGPRGRIPTAAAVCLRNRYGDCKEHSLLLYQLLRSQGIASSLTLANTEDEIDDQLPDLNQFNHMILWVPSYRGGSFFDCTDDYLPSGDLPPDGLAGNKVLVLEPGKVRIQAIPDYPQNGNQVISRRKIAIREGRLAVDEHLVLNGYFGAWMRGYFAVRDAAGTKRRLQQFLNYDGLRLKNVEFGNLSDTSRPLTIALQYDLAKNLQTTRTGEKEVRLPGMWELYYLKPSYQDERKSPFELSHPFLMETQVEFEKSPEMNWNALALGDLAKGRETDFHKWTLDVSKSAGNPVVKWRFEQKPGIHPSGEYHEYVEASEKALEAWNEEIPVD